MKDQPVMSNRYLDWFRQSEADLHHARNALADQDFEWSCFASHQAAEKAIKAVFLKNGKDAWGHTLTVLLGNLEFLSNPALETLVNDARGLDKFYIPTRYPISFESGAPTDFYTLDEAQKAISQAEAIIAFCRDQID
jgi:HEPN domain-containing protein